MPMTAQQIQDTFKFIGKLIHFGQLVDTYGPEFKKTNMAAVDQGVTGIASEFDLMKNVLVPLNSQVDQVVAALDKTPAAAKTQITNFLTKVIGPQHLALSSGAAVGTVIDSLITEMNTATQTVLEDGDFDAYFTDEFAKDLPVHATTPTIDDAWISSTVV